LVKAALGCFVWEQLLAGGPDVIGQPLGERPDAGTVAPGGWSDHPFELKEHMR
jgi:hypothetical protein